MTSSIRKIAPSAVFRRRSALCWLPVAVAIAAAVLPGTADARVRARGGYDGVWNVVFATTRGNCSSGYSVPFTVTGGRVSSAGGGRVSGTVGRSGGVAVNVSVFPGEWRRPAGRQWRRRLVARDHFRRPLQRHLAGDAELERFRAKACPALDAGWVAVRVKKTRQNKRP